MTMVHTFEKDNTINITSVILHCGHNGNDIFTDLTSLILYICHHCHISLIFKNSYVASLIFIIITNVIPTCIKHSAAILKPIVISNSE